MTSGLTERLVSRPGAALLMLVALLSYAIQALAWPLQRGRDSWDYWLTFLQLADRDPPFSALQVFRTPVAPLVTGIPMWLGGARLTEIAFAFLYALSLLGWTWAVVPISRRAALATALVLLVTPTYAGLFHEVSSDPVFAFLVAWWAGAVVRAWKTGATWWLVGVGVGVALMTLCRPASQVALLGCILVPLVARRGARRIAAGVAVSLAAAVIPLGAWAVHNAVRYDDFTVARGGKAWVPFFRVGGAVEAANGDASRRLANAVERKVLPLPPYASRDVDVQTYFHGLGNLEVIRMIALSDEVFGWDSDYDVLFDASLEAIREDPWWYVRGVADTFWDFLSQRYAPEPRERPVPIPEQPAELTIDGKPFPAPITVSPLVQAVRYGFVWCPTDDLERCVVPDPVAALGNEAEARRYGELVDRLRDWNAQLPTRDSNASLASKAGTASVRWPRPILWIAVALVALAVRRPRGSAPVLIIGGVAALVLLVHALSQAPQNEFQLPFVPVWIAAALVAVLAPRGASMTRIEVIRVVISAIDGRRYLEIGVNDGECFDAVEAATKVAVDPQFAFRPPLAARLRTALRATTGALYYRTTSDAFFQEHGRRLAPFDVVFVDGLHTYDQAYRDVVNALDVLQPDGVVVVHDCNPASAAAAAPSLEQARRIEGFEWEWNGDVYKAIVRLRARDDLRVSVLDCDQGVGIVTRGTPETRVELSLEEIGRLEYAGLARDRARLLGLRSPGELPLMLAGPRG